MTIAEFLHKRLILEGYTVAPDKPCTGLIYTAKKQPGQMVVVSYKRAEKAYTTGWWQVIHYKKNKGNRWKQEGPATTLETFKLPTC